MRTLSGYPLNGKYLQLLGGWSQIFLRNNLIGAQYDLMSPILLCQYNLLLSPCPPDSTIFIIGKRNRIKKNIREQYLYTVNKRIIMVSFLFKRPMTIWITKKKLKVITINHQNQIQTSNTNDIELKCFKDCSKKHLKIHKGANNIKCCF